MHAVKPKSPNLGGGCLPIIVLAALNSERKLHVPQERPAYKGPGFGHVS